MRVGFVGVGVKGSQHLRNLLHIEGVEIRAVCDIREEACRQAQAWRKSNGVDLKVSVNLSPRTIQRPDLHFQVQQMLGDARLDPASLTKLMTAWLVFDALKQKRIALDQVMTVSDRGYRAEGSRMFLEPRIPAWPCSTWRCPG